MKKILSIALALMMALGLICTAALADEVPQPEGGRKFESNWAKMNGLIEIYYEEEGYRVSVDLYNEVDKTGTLWEYSCYYVEENDALESISSRKITYTLDPHTLDRTFGEYEYEGLDDIEETSVFTISASGALTWKDGHENRGQDLKFRNIGRFDGLWRNEAEALYAEFHWQGLYDENTYHYDIFVSHEGGGQYVGYNMEGLYDPETGKLEADITNVTAAPGTEAAGGEHGRAVFTDLGGGKLLYETDRSFVLEYDLLGPES